MRTHRLSDLEIEGRDKVLQVEPGFDFYGIQRARAVAIEFGGEEDASEPSLVLVADYLTSAKAEYILTIQFEGIRELVLPEMQPFLRVAELEVEDIRHRMWEGVCFEIVAHYDRSFRCLCRRVAVVSFEPLS